MTSKLNIKTIFMGCFTSILFLIINNLIINNPFNLPELLMVIMITIYSTYIYAENHDYLDPRLCFPILYFLIYWLGNFTFELYQPVPSNIWWLYFAGLIGFYIGSTLSQLVVRISKFKDNKDYMSPIARKIIFFIFMVGVTAQLLMFMKNGIPLFAGNIDASRQSMAENFSVLKILASIIPIAAVFAFYDLISMKEKNNVFPFLDCLIIVIAFFISTLSVSRMLIIQMVFPMFVIYILKVRRLKVKTILLIALIIFIYIGLNQIMRNMRSNVNYMAAISQRGNNLFENVMISCLNNFRVGVDDFYKLVLVVPSSSNYTHGRMFLNAIMSPLPGKQIVMGYYVMSILGLSFDGIGAATTILGMFYLDGGMPLIFIGMLIFGMFVQIFYKKYIYKNTVTIYSLLAIYILYYAINSIRTNVMPTIEPLLISSYYLIFSFIVWLFRGNNE